MNDVPLPEGKEATELDAVKASVVADDAKAGDGKAGVGKAGVAKAGVAKAGGPDGTGDASEDMPLPHDPQTIFLGGLLLIAVFAVLQVMQAVVLPIVIALVMKLLLQPVVRLLERIRVPRGIGAIIAILLLVGVLAGLGTILSGPVGEMAQNLPEWKKAVQERIASLHGLVDRAKPVLSTLGLEGAGGNPLEGIMGKVSGFAGAAAGAASGFASHLIETLLILFYMLTFGETFMLRLIEVLPRFGDKKQAVDISTTVERDISAYLLTITVINAVVGTACGAVMWGFGIPGAPVWGVVAFCLNYIPILGPFSGVAIFAVVGLGVLGGSWFSLLPAVAYLAIHFAEGEFITPMLLAKRFTLNPIAIMISLVFWYWLWGVQGAILSVPLLAIIKIVSDRIRPMRALGHMLEG